MRNAWIEKTTGGRFYVVTDSILFPGHQNRVLATWANRSSAMRYCKKNSYTVNVGRCPLPRVTDEQRQRYRDGK